MSVAVARRGSRLIVAQPHWGLKELRFGAKGQPSALATQRYEEVLANLGA